MKKAKRKFLLLQVSCFIAHIRKSCLFKEGKIGRKLQWRRRYTGLHAVYKSNGFRGPTKGLCFKRRNLFQLFVVNILWSSLCAPQIYIDIIYIITRNQVNFRDGHTVDTCELGVTIDTSTKYR